ncbi:MAG: VaFE repeat-containing surface-anchored protein [Clostridia bacterium]|nr:VaFE repeat-containing surface-anchored protein [Clostridia bacterium]
MRKKIVRTIAVLFILSFLLLTIGVSYAETGIEDRMAGIYEEGLEDVPVKKGTLKASGESLTFTVTLDDFVGTLNGMSSYGKSSHFIRTEDGETVFCGTDDVRFFGSNDNGGVAERGQTATLTFQEVDDEIIRKILYYGEGGPEEKVSGPDGYQITHFALCLKGLKGTLRSGVGEDTLRQVNGFISLIEGLPETPSDFTAYRYTGYGSGSGGIRSGQDMYTRVYEEKKTGRLRIRKRSATPDITDGNPMYSLKGAVFEVTDRDGKLMGTLTTDEKGYTGYLNDLEEGTYLIYEIQSPEGYFIDDTITEFEVRSGGEDTLVIYDEPVVYFPDIMILKSGEPMGDATLKGAEFTVSYYPVYAETVKELAGLEPMRTWVFRTDKDGRIFPDPSYLKSGDPLYELNGRYVLPPGTLLIKETKAPEGFLINDEFFISGTGGNEIIKRLGPYATLRDELIRGGFTVLKTGDVPDKDMTAAFEIINRSMESILYEEKEILPGEVITEIETDSEGRYESDLYALPYGSYGIREIRAPEGFKIDEEEHGFRIEEHGAKVEIIFHDEYIYGDLEFRKLREDGTPLENISFILRNEDTGEERLIKTDEKGYFSTRSPIESRKTEGSLPFGRYTLRELRTDENEGLELIEYGFEVTGETALISESFTDREMPDPIIHTKADFSGEKEAYPSHDMVLTDTVSYEGLTEGLKYMLKASIRHKDGTPVMRNGKELASEVTFTAVESSGEVQVEIYLGALSYELMGEDIVVFEQLYNMNGVLRASHEDPSDSDQTVSIKRPEIRTSAYGSDTWTKTLTVSHDTVLSDKVMYTGLEKGLKYTLRTSAVSVSTGKEIQSAVSEFTPDSSDGYFTADISLDTKKLTGERIVVYEDIYLGDMLIASHRDIHDISQTVWIPCISTKASDGITGSVQGSLYSSGIKDRISVKGLAPEEEYILKAWLLDGEGNSVEGSELMIAFTAVSGEYEEEIALPLIKGPGAGMSYQVLTELYQKDVLLCRHKDPDNETVVYPSVHTEASSQDRSKILKRSESAVILDDVTLTGLVPGCTYVIETRVYDGTLRNIVEGSLIRTEVAPETSDMTLTVSIPVDSSLRASHALTVYEKVYLVSDGEKVLLAAHEDPHDDLQTVKVEGELPKTGEGTDFMLIAGLLLMLTGGAALIITGLRGKGSPSGDES